MPSVGAVAAVGVPSAVTKTLASRFDVREVDPESLPNDLDGDVACAVLGESMSAADRDRVRSALERDDGPVPLVEYVEDPGRLDPADPVESEFVVPAVGDEEVRNALLLDRVGAAVDGVRGPPADEFERLRHLFRTFPIPMVHGYAWKEDPRPIVLDVNDAFEAEFGLERAELVGEPIDDHITPDSEATLNPESMTDGWLRAEVQREAADGRRDYLLYVSVYRETESRVWGHAAWVDLEEQKRRERSLRQANRQLEQFTDMVTHDLRTPLSVAAGNLELLAEEVESERVRTVRDAVERMGDIVDDVRTLADAGDAVETETVDLASVAERAWTGVAGPEDRLEVADELPAVFGNPGLLTELFQNLLSNAVRHGGPGVTVRVEPTAEGFVVADDGPGIEPERRETVFESGHSTHEDGSGYGLVIVRRIAEIHDWTVAVGESEAGGATFEFTGVEFD